MAGRLRRRAWPSASAPVARFTGWCRRPTCASWFSAADVAAVPLPRPPSRAAALALALAYRHAGAAVAGAGRAAPAPRPPWRCRAPPRGWRGAWRRWRPTAAPSPGSARRPDLGPRSRRGRRSPGATSTSTRRSRVTTAVLAGAFGQRNPATRRSCARSCTALPSGWDAVATSSTPAETQTAHGVPAVHARDGLAVARAVVGADAVVFAGGTVFKRLSPATGRPPLDLLAKALAVAAGPDHGPAAGDGRRRRRAASPRSARLLARTLVSRADLLVLRDEESAGPAGGRRGRAAPFRVGSDAAWTLMHDAPDAHAGANRSWSRSATRPAAGRSPTTCPRRWRSSPPPAGRSRCSRGRSPAWASTTCSSPRPSPAACAAPPRCSTRPPTCARRGRCTGAARSCWACASTRSSRPPPPAPPSLRSRTSPS